MPSSINTSTLLELDQWNQESLNSLVEIFHQISDDDQFGHLLVLDKLISPYINRLTPFTNLKALTRIENVIWLDSQIDLELLKNAKSIVFLSVDTLPQIELISNIVKTKILPLQIDVKLSAVFNSSNEHFDYLMIENLNLKGDLTVYNWKQMTPVVLAEDLLSLQDSNCLQKLYQFKSISPVTKLSEALINLVRLSQYKLRFTNVFAMGNLSQIFVKDYMKNFENHKSTLSPLDSKLLQDIDDCLFLDQHSFYNRQCDLVVLERSTDMISPLLTQLTYMGLIDEFYGVELNEIEIVDSSHNKVKIPLDDELLQQELKDLNFSQIGLILNAKAKSLQEIFESRHKANDIKQIRNFVDKLSDLTGQQSLVKNHTLIAENIMQKVKNNEDDDDEDEIYFNTLIDLQQQIISNNYDNATNCSKLLQFMHEYQAKFEDFIKLVILTSIVKRGLRLKEYHILQKEMLEAYGFEIFTDLRTLNELGLFRIRERNGDNFTSLFTSSDITSTNSELSHLQGSFHPNAQLIKDFSQLNYHLNLIPVNLEEGKDPDFVLPGYVPIIARLIQGIYTRDFTASSAVHLNSVKPGWKKFNEILGKSFHESVFEESLLVPEDKKHIFKKNDPTWKKNQEQEYIIFVMIGGITYAELAAVRFIVDKINKDQGLNKKLVVLTNDVIKSGDIVKIGTLN